MSTSESLSRFLTFEGGEGVGKTTQIKLLSKFLDSIDIKHIITREPGGSVDAEEIRKLLVQGGPARWDAKTETLLHFAARRDHLVNTIIPALKSGKWVLCDRYVDSTYAYQGYGHKISINKVEEIYHFISDGLQPDFTFVLDLPADVGLARATSRFKDSKTACQEDRYEQMGLEFHERIRRGFIKIAQARPQRYTIIDASEDPDSVFNSVKEAIPRHYFEQETEVK